MTSPGLATRALTGRSARRTYVAATYRGTAVPTVRERHMLNRMGCGFSVSSLAQLRDAGDELAWFDQQLEPDTVPERAKALAVPGWFPHLADDPVTVWNNDQSDRYQSWEYARDLANCSMLRRVYSTRSVLETMVEFWSNHLHIDSRSFPAFTNRSAYDATVRQHALGTFSDLLVATTLHPAMLLFLDNWKSIRNNPNENHGRELLELHTVGRDGGYTEAMVKDSAKLLSGWTVSRDDWRAYYDPNRHTTGSVTVLGFSRPNSTADNPDLAVGYLRYLASHPATADRIARKLCVRFVADNPSPALVQRVARAFLDSGTDIRATLRAIVESDEFWASEGGKVRTPIDDLVATLRVLQVKAKAPVDSKSFVNELAWAVNNILPFQWPRPDGPPESAQVWASTTRMLNSWRMHWLVAGGWYPDGQVVYRPATHFLPEPGIRLDAFVDHLSRTVLGRPSSNALLQAVCQGCDVAPGDKVTRTHPVMSYKFYRVMAVLLDSPAHMTR